jgi:hypothetical protein
VDVVDLRLDLASAVQSTLTLYEARQEDGGEESEESDDEWVSVTMQGVTSSENRFLIHT